jgi:hypothetical protein
MLITSTRNIRALEPVLLPREVLLALGTTLTEEVLACLRCRDLLQNGSFMSQYIFRNISLASQHINPNEVEGHRSVSRDETEDAALRDLSLTMHGTLGKHGMLGHMLVTGKYGLSMTPGKYGILGILRHMSIVRHRHKRARFYRQGHPKPMPQFRRPVQLHANHLCRKRKTAGG